MKLKAQSINGKVKLTWDGLPGVDSYRLKRNDGAGLNLLVDLKTCTYIDEKVQKWQTYTYVIVAVLYGTEFKSSNKVTVKV